MIGLGVMGFEHKIVDILRRQEDLGEEPVERSRACAESDKEELALLQQSENRRLPGIMVRRAVNAGRADDWSELMKSEELNPWMIAKLKASYGQATQDDDECKSIVQQIMQKSTDFLRRIVVPVEGQGGVALSHVCPDCHRYPLEDYIKWVSLGYTAKSRKKQSGGTRAKSSSYRTVWIPAR